MSSKTRIEEVRAIQTPADIRVDIACHRASVRKAERLLKLAEAQAEQRVIDAAGDPKALGSNETDRRRALLLAIERDADYTDARAQYEALLAHKERLEAQLANHTETLKERELVVRDRLATAMLSHATQDVSSVADAVADDAAYEAAVADGAVTFTDRGQR